MYDEWGDYIGYAVKPDHVKLSKEETDYRDATDAEKEARTRCYDCRFYGWGTCHLVEGTIEADDLCDLFKPSVQTVPERVMTMYSATGADVGTYALFQPFAYAADGDDGKASPVLPEWFDYYPAPGRFQHDLYGEIVITPEGNDELVANFKAGVFQDRIPIDCEHDLESSGAVGWIVDMRVGEFGQVQAKAEWNDRGEALLTGDRFRYFSPHLWPTWKEPVNQTEFHNVAIGGAICVRPFFNQNHLTPLVATADGGVELVQRAERPLAATSGTAPAARSVSVITLTPVPARQREEEVPVMGNQPGDAGTTPADVTTAAPAKPEGAPQFSQAEAEAFRQFMAEGGPAAFKALQTQVVESEKTIAALKADDRRKRFTAMVRGLEGEDEGAPWTGSIEAHVKLLEHLADTAGEESEVFTGYLETQRAAAEVASKSTLFSEAGSGKRPVLGVTAQDRLDALVQQYTATGLDEEAALHKVATEHRDVYDAAGAEISERV